MKALLFLPGNGQWVEEIDVDNTLKALQKAVGGYIETVTVCTDACLICNEEGRLLGLEPQQILGATFYGRVLLVGTKGDEFTNVPEGICKLFERKAS